MICHRERRGVNKWKSGQVGKTENNGETPQEERKEEKGRQPRGGWGLEGLERKRGERGEEVVEIPGLQMGGEDANGACHMIISLTVILHTMQTMQT